MLAALDNLPADWRRKVAIATTRWNSPTLRPSDPHFTRKWALTKGEIPWPVHAPYSNGYFSLLGYDHVADLALAMFFTKPFHIDDAWLGLVMQRIDLHFSVPPGIEYSTKPGPNLSRYICVPLNSILNAPSQTQL
ncbi:unnamed protein product [Dibothriocephalus latus]|uniref:Hexosyltransferase n=1 Tax=Dibothriocephalus latus TaxID=60516 RepID=A0A3P6QPH0_DIBLA|nr:unnamed protein product [Dibothriocephalus latus]